MLTHSARGSTDRTELYAPAQRQRVRGLGLGGPGTDGAGP